MLPEAGSTGVNISMTFTCLLQKQGNKSSEKIFVGLMTKTKKKNYVFSVKTLVTLNFDDNTIKKTEALHKMQRMLAQFELSNS